MILTCTVIVKEKNVVCLRSTRERRGLLFLFFRGFGYQTSLTKVMKEGNPTATGLLCCVVADGFLTTNVALQLFPSFGDLGGETWMCVVSLLFVFVLFAATSVDFSSR